MMLSVLHFVMGDFLHEKVVTQRELNIKAGFPLRTLHFVQKKRIMRLFRHCCVTSDGRIRFGQGQNWQKVRTLIFPATFVFMKGENILEILCEIYPFLDHRYILCPHRPTSLHFHYQDNRCHTTGAKHTWLCREIIFCKRAKDDIASLWEPLTYLPTNLSSCSKWLFLWIEMHHRFCETSCHDNVCSIWNSSPLVVMFLLVTSMGQPLPSQSTSNAT